MAVHDAHAQFISARYAGVEVCAHALCRAVRRRRSVRERAVLSFCGDFLWGVIAVCAADMFSRSRCLTRSVGRSIAALRQVRSYSAHANVPLGTAVRRNCSWTPVPSHAKLTALGL